MQQEKRILDQQLSSNNLTRVPTSVTKSKLSLFRALSLSIYFDENHVEDVMRVMKLTLLCACNCKYPQMNPFPSPHRKAKFMPKFTDSDETIEMYVQNPDRQCFIYDNLQLASLGYQRRVILFTLSPEMYLQQNLITACCSKVKQPPIMLAKISNRFFCVQSQATRSVMMFIRENIVNQMIQPESKEDSKKKHNHSNIFYYPQQYSPTLRAPRSHKKSLSDCGDIMVFNSQYGKQQNYYGNEEVHHPHSIQGYDEANMDQMMYQHYSLINSEPRLERSTNIYIPPNQRYQGRLKFFQQSGNYGFIVVDGYGVDLFVHYDDLQKTGIPKQCFLNIRNSEEMRFEFTCLEYDGKYKKSRKAVDLKLIK